MQRGFASDHCMMQQRVKSLHCKMQWEVKSMIFAEICALDDAAEGHSSSLLYAPGVNFLCCMMHQGA
jgi:hypothetical protein